MLPHARVVPVKNPMGNTFVTHVLRVMSLCFSSEIIPVYAHGGYEPAEEHAEGGDRGGEVG